MLPFVWCFANVLTLGFRSSVYCQQHIAQSASPYGVATCPMSPAAATDPDLFVAYRRSSGGEKRALPSVTV